MVLCINLWYLFSDNSTELSIVKNTENDHDMALIVCICWTINRRVKVKTTCNVYIMLFETWTKGKMDRDREYDFR